MPANANNRFLQASSFVLTVLLFLFASLQRLSAQAFPLREQQKKAVLLAGNSFAALFQLVKEVPLDTSGGSYLGMISDVAMNSKGDIIVADHSVARQVFMFSSRGSFIGSIGGAGHGPGEYQRPAFVRLDEEDNIYIGDIGSGKLLVYTPERKYKSSFHLKKNPNRMTVNSKGVYVQSFDFSEENTIFHFSFDGSLLNAFSPIDEKFKPLLVIMYAGGGLVSDENENLYQITVAKYEITKFSSQGRSITTFTRSAPFLRGHNASLPPIQDRRAWQKLSYERTLIHNMFYLQPGYLFVQCINHDEKRNPSFMLEIFDLEGNLVGKEIQLPNMIVAGVRDMICFVEQAPSSGSKEIPNPKLQFYRLKQ
jgi:hypothetical protein